MTYFTFFLLWCFCKPLRAHLCLGKPYLEDSRGTQGLRLPAASTALEQWQSHQIRFLFILLPHAHRLAFPGPMSVAFLLGLANRKRKMEKPGNFSFLSAPSSIAKVTGSLWPQPSSDGPLCLTLTPGLWQHQLCPSWRWYDHPDSLQLLIFGSLNF